MVNALKRFARWIHRTHHLAQAKDMEFVINHHTRMLERLPGEIARVRELRRYHLGRADTLAAPRSTVNFKLGRTHRR